jgi:hypothetical protein
VPTSETSLLQQFTGPTCRAFVQTWCNWRDAAGTVMPARSGIAPESLGRLMADCLVMDFDGEALEPVIRLAGSQVVERWGFEPTGMRFRDCLPGEHADWRVDVIREAVQHPCGMRLVREVMRRHGLAYRAEICFLPVDDDRRGVCQFFAVSDSDERPFSVDTRANPAAREGALDITYVDIGAGVPSRRKAAVG